MSELVDVFLQHEAALRRYLSRLLKRPQDVEDALQETFLRAFAASGAREIRAPKLLLFTVAKHVALNEVNRSWRKMNRSTEDFGGSDVFTDTGASHPVDVLDSRARLLHFARAIAELPPACRHVFWLRKVEGLKVMEIAARLGISGSAVEKHVASGLLKCSQYFRSIGIDPVDLMPIAADLDGLREGAGRSSAGGELE